MDTSPAPLFNHYHWNEVLSLSSTNIYGLVILLQVTVLCLAGSFVSSLAFIHYMQDNLSSVVTTNVSRHAKCPPGKQNHPG